MSDIQTSAIDPQAIRRLVLDAREVVIRVRLLPEQASSAEARRWAELTVQGVDSDWALLYGRLERGDVDYLWPDLSAIVTTAVPLSDAPAELAAGVSAAREMTSRLAEELDETMTSLTDENLDLRAEVIPDLARTMRDLAATLAADPDNL